MNINEAIQYLNDKGYLIEQQISYTFWKKRLIAYLNDNNYNLTQDCISFIKTKYEEGLPPIKAAKELIKSGLPKKYAVHETISSVTNDVKKELEKLINGPVLIDDFMKERINYYKKYNYKNIQIAKKLYNYVKNKQR
jgi:hypothetical protein